MRRTSCPTGQTMMDFEKDILRDVLGLGPVSESLDGESEERCRGERVQSSETVGIPREDCADQLPISSATFGGRGIELLPGRERQHPTGLALRGRGVDPFWVRLPMLIGMASACFLWMARSAPQIGQRSWIVFGIPWIPRGFAGNPSQSFKSKAPTRRWERDQGSLSGERIRAYL